MSKYYAVISGRQPGIYTEWSTAEKMVKGYSGAVYKSFKTYEEAKRFFDQGIISKQPVLQTNQTKVYTDGSSGTIDTLGTIAGGFGAVILPNNGNKFTAYGRVPVGNTNNIAELYAIYVALSLVNTDVIIYSDSQYSINALTIHIEDYKTNKNLPNRDLIIGVYNKIGNRSVSFQYVPAHTGIIYNEEADQLSNQGRYSNESLVVIKNGERIR